MHVCIQYFSTCAHVYVVCVEPTSSFRPCFNCLCWCVMASSLLSQDDLKLALLAEPLADKSDMSCSYFSKALLT